MNAISCAEIGSSSSSSASSRSSSAVMNAAQMRWLLDHDYGADSELTSSVADNCTWSWSARRAR